MAIADDTLLMCYLGTVKSFNIILTVLNQFQRCMVIGERVLFFQLTKSINVKELAGVLGCELGNLPH